MQLPLYFLLFFGSIFVVQQQHVLVLGQQCQTYDPSIATATADLCSPFVTDQIYSPRSIPIAQALISSTLNSSSLYQFRQYLPVIPLSCLNSILSLVCNTAFIPCQNVFVPALNSTEPLPFPPCRSLCETVNDVCQTFFTNYNHTAINCSMDSQILPGNPAFPIDHDSILINGVLVNDTCYTADKLPDPSIIWNVSSCPFPLAFGDLPSSAKPYSNTAPIGRCTRPCPVPAWTHDQWVALGNIILAFGTISFVLMLLLSIHYIVDPSCRKTSMRFQLYSFLCIMIFSLGWMLGGSHPLEKVWCQSPAEISTLKDTTCGTQAVFLVYGGLSQALWWAISAGCLYFRLGAGMFIIAKRVELLFHIIAWGIPAVFVIVAARLNTIQYTPAAPICFVTGTPPGSNLDYDYIFFYIPMCVPMLVAIGFMVMSSMKLLVHTKMMKRTFKEHQVQAQLSLTQVNIRLFVWCFTLFLIFFTYVAYRGITQSIQNNFEASLISWAQCKVKYALGLTPDDIGCETNTFPHSISFPGSVVHYVIVPSIGLFSFLALGLSPHIWKFWKLLVRLILDKKYDDVIILLTNERALSKMSDSSNEEKHTSDKGGKLLTGSLTSSMTIPVPNNTNNSSDISDVEMTVTSNPSPTDTV